VGLYGVVVLFGRWVRVGCARLYRVHSFTSLFCGPGSGVLPAPAEPLLYPTTLLYMMREIFAISMHNVVY
jgi:hypothetical protein